MERAVRSRGTEEKQEEKIRAEGGWLGLDYLPRTSVCSGRIIPVPGAGILSWTLL